MRSALAGLRLDLRCLAIRRREALTWWLAKRVPHEVASRVFCLIVGHATTGCYGNTIVPELAAMEALRRWDTPNTPDTPYAAGGPIPAGTPVPAAVAEREGCPPRRPSTAELTASPRLAAMIDRLAGRFSIIGRT
jgi:hypothetical protein